jgi:hypothetical protein
MQERTKIRQVVAGQMQGKTLGIGINYAADQTQTEANTDEVDCIALNGVKYVKAIDLLKHL